MLTGFYALACRTALALGVEVDKGLTGMQDVDVA
jgi:hypothetical protein